MNQIGNKMQTMVALIGRRLCEHLTASRMDLHSVTPLENGSQSPTNEIDLLLAGQVIV